MLGFGFLPLSLGVSFAFGTDFIKMKSVFVRTCALRRKPKSPFLTECLLVSSRLHFNSLLYIMIENIHLQDFELTVQAALGLLYLSATSLLALNVSKRISLLASSDQMALPSGHPQAFREKGLT